MKKIRAFAICALTAANVAFMAAAFDTLRRPATQEASADTRVAAEIYYIGDASVTAAGGVEVVDGSQRTYRYLNHAAGWSAAYAASAKSESSRLIKVVLASDWTASAATVGESQTTAFGVAGDNSNGFHTNGALFLDGNADIYLDLNGKTLSRNLTEAKPDGYVLKVASGAKLEVADSSVTHGGKITGGFNNSHGGGVYSAGSFTLSSGAITENKLAAGVDTNGDGAGVYVASNSSFTMAGGEISYNVIQDTSYSYGAGVHSRGSFTMTGGRIANNRNKALSNVYGGGVAAWSGSFTMSGGEISTNFAEGLPTSSSVYACGGGIFVYGANVTLKGNAKVSGNKTHLYQQNGSSLGGGIYMFDSTSVVKISENAEVSGNETYRGGDGVVTGTVGGGIYMSSEKNTLDMDGGKIINNYSDCSGAIESNGKLNISGGEISGNRANRIGGINLDGANQKAVLTLSGNPKIKDNVAYGTDYAYGVDALDINNRPAYKSNVYLRAGVTEGATVPDHYLRIGKLTQGADIGFVTGGVNEVGSNVGKPEGEIFATRYLYGTNAEKHNVETITVGGVTYDKPVTPSTYFHSDRNKSVVVNEDGNLLETEKQLSFAAKHVSDAVVVEPTVVDGYCFETNYEPGIKATAYVKEGANGLAISIVDKDDNVFAPTEVISAGVYYVKATTQDGIKLKYMVVIRPKALEASDVTVDAADISYSGAEKTPPVKVQISSVTLVNTIDYFVEYKDNVNVGSQAKAIVKGINNYMGEIVKNFTIKPKTNEYGAAWQYKSGNDWIALPETGSVFSYEEGVSYSGKLRLHLTVAGAEGMTINVVGGKGAENETGLSLKFTLGGNVAEDIKDAGEYTVTVIGESNFTLKEEYRTARVVVAPKLLTYAALDFKDFNGTPDEVKGQNRLWLLDGTSSGLNDRTTYFDPDVAVDPEYGAKVTTGAYYNAYVRYSGSERSIALNPAYSFADTTIAAISNIATIEYENEKARGEADTVNVITTTVTITFNDNYKVDESGSKTITFEKVWYIVTVNNLLRTLSGSETIEITGWTYGDAVDVAPFRAEHGNVVIYTIYKGGNAMPDPFAVEYTEDLEGAEARIAYYKAIVSTSGGYTIDHDNAINEENYLSKRLRALAAGNYTVNAYAPRYQTNENHTHWWDENGTIASEKIVYYPVSKSCEFVVSQFALTGDNTSVIDNEETKVLVDFLEASVYFNRAANNLPGVRITFNGKSLVNGEDFTITSDDVNVGAASVTITGKGSFSGVVDISNAYNIIPAQNEWIVMPTISQWACGDYKKNINLIKAEAAFCDNASDLWFKIAVDSEGKNAYVGLEEFRLVDGEVDAIVADTLFSLPAGEYYLFASVNDNANYEGLASRAAYFKVFLATNEWLVSPSVINWSYGSFNKEANRIIATSKFGNEDVKFTVKNEAGEIIAENFKTENGIVQNIMNGETVVTDVISALDGLDAGNYFLICKVEGSDQYTELNPEPIPFTVSKAYNSWAESDGDLVLPTWVVGEYNSEVNKFIIKAARGTVHLMVVDNLVNGTEYFIADGDVVRLDNLKDCQVGTYYIKAWVNEDDNFTQLYERVFTFEVVKKTGWPWWVTLCVTSGALLLAAGVLFVLWKMGVFTLLTDKLIIAIRTRASVDATIASVRAAKRMEEGRRSVAEAKLREEQERALQEQNKSEQGESPKKKRKK